MISENPYLKNIIWNKVSAVVDPSSISCSLYAIAIPLLIFAACIAIDQIRKLVFKIIAKSGVPQKINAWASDKIDPYLQL